MRLFYTILVMLLLSLSVTLSAIGQTLVFENLNVLTMEEERIHTSQTVIVQDGMIEWVGPAAEAELPAGAEVVSGEYYLMPGLAEMHAHIPSMRQGEEYMHHVLKMYVAQGITTIRGMLGESSHLDLREKAAAGELISPRIFTSGPSFNGNSAPDPETARQMVREQKDAGYDLLKLHPGLSLDTFRAIADEARNADIEFAGHISYDVGLVPTLEERQASIDHLDRYMEYMAGEAANRPDPSIIYFGYDLTPYVDERLMQQAAAATAEAGVWNVPTNTLSENVFNPDLTVDVMMEWPGVDLMPEQVINGWQNYIGNLRSSEDYDPDQARQYLALRQALTLELHQSGAGLLLGADAPQIFNPPGYSAHRELELLVASGLTPYEALKTGTVNVGNYFGEADKTGKVAPGYRADLILLSVNPLESIPFGGYIEGVATGGTWYSLADLERFFD
jgi:hypothetical protein